MFHVHINVAKEQLEPLLIAIYQETGIGITSYLTEINKDSCYFEVSIGDQYAKIPKEDLKKVFKSLNELLGVRPPLL